MDCTHCVDGLVFATEGGYSRMYRCACPLGQAIPAEFTFSCDKRRDKPPKKIATRKSSTWNTSGPVGRERAAGSDDD